MILFVPQQLEPFQSGPTLHGLREPMRPPAASADGEGAIAWLAAVGHHTVGLLLGALYRHRKSKSAGDDVTSRVCAASSASRLRCASSFV